MSKKVDVLVENQGSLILFVLISKAVREWVEAHVQVADYMWTGKAIFACEHRCAPDLIEGMRNEGFVVQ